MQDVGNTTSSATICALRQIFAIEGLPETIVKDNETQLTSKQFEEFRKQLNISHITSPMFHPASNGEAERFLQTFKQGMKKNYRGNVEIQELFRSVLASYRIHV